MSTPQWCFDHFRLDLATACLWHGVEAVVLPPKAFGVLHYLVRHADRLVTKDELLDAVWPDTAVSDAVIRVAIRVLRKALRDTQSPPRFIATVPRRGYRFLALVTLVDPSALAPPETGLLTAAPVAFSQEALPSILDIPTQQVETASGRCVMCHTPLNLTARFCIACGAPVTKTCQACGQAVPVWATFCPECGQRLEVLPPQTVLLSPTQSRISRMTMVGERKQVTVLWSEINDTLMLLSTLDAEVVQQLLEPALRIMVDAVQRYDGTVQQMVGDGMIALFGVPIAHEDHALRACYAALAIQAALHAYAEEVRRTHGCTLQCRIGLHAGEVVVRAVRHDLPMEYSLLGQTLYVAEHLRQVAPPETILLTATTARLVAGVVRVKAVEPISLKGLGDNVDVCELLGAGSSRRRLQTARVRGLTPFVGRQTELATLQRALTQAAAGHGQIVAIVGEAGVGKSRLVDEFIQDVQAQGWLVLDSAAVSYGQATPYFPVLDLLRRYCHVEERDDVGTVQARVTEQMLTLDVSFQDIIPALLALLEALPADSPFRQFDAPQRRQQTLNALKRIFLHESQRQPVLLVVEDLHWLDTETQTLLDSLSASLPTAHLLLLLNYRPDYQHHWGSKTYYTQLRLDPLPPMSAEAFLHALLGNDASLVPLRQFLIQRTQGNPFFLEESVRTLVETDTLAGEPGAYRMAHPFSTPQVPATVQTVLAARLDRLPSEAKRILQTAAVIGHEVPLPLLQTIVELPKATLHGRLAHLQAAEFLYETRLFPEREYAFKHTLTREVAYGGLLQEQRRGLHARIVEVLETLVRDRMAEQVERLAYHALRGEVWNKALAYCRQAGEKAMAQSAYRQAIEYFEQALSTLPHMPETRDTREQAIDLRLALRSALLASGNVGRIPALLREAEALAAALDDPHRLGQVSNLLVFHCASSSAFDQAIAVAQRALTLATASGQAVPQALAHQYLGRVYWCQGDYGRALHCLRQAIASLEGTRHHERFDQIFLPAVACRTYLALCSAELGMFNEGRALGDEGLRIAANVAHLASQMHASWGIGLLTLQQGDLPRALPLLEQAVGMCQDTDLPILFPPLAMALGAAYTLAGRIADAIPLLTRAMTQAMALAWTGLEAHCHLLLGEAHCLADRLEEAHALASRAHALAHERQERGTQAYALCLLGTIAVQRQPPETALAETHYRQALALAEKLGMRPLQAHCHRCLGTLYSQVGQAQQARTTLSMALTLYRAMDMTFWLPQTEAALAAIDGVAHAR